MEATAARLNSFKKSKRVKNPDKPSSTVTLKWPHPSDFKANPETLAEAGFYYDPAYDDPDNVTCYICQKELAGWEEDDDPFLLHWVKCGQRCCWASLRCGLTVDVDDSGRFISTDKARNPTHKSMEKARLETFSAGKGWIHDQTKSHGASSIIMARAGFVYAPQDSGDDLATCLYCGVSLRGWDPEDDPMAEHRKRAAKSDTPCAFFMALEPPSQSLSTKPTSKAQTKQSSKTSSKSKHQDIVVATKTFDGEEDEDETSEITKPPKSTAKTPRKPRSTSSSSTNKSTAKPASAKSRSTNRSALKDVVEEEDDEEVSEVEELKEIKKKVPSRSKSVIKSGNEDDRDAPSLQPPPTIKKKPRSRSKSVAKVYANIEDEDATGIEQAPTAKKKAKSQSKSAAKPVVEVESENEVVESHKPARKTRNPPTQESADEAGEEVPRKSSRSKTKGPAPGAASRKVSRSKSKLSVAPYTTEEHSRKPSRTKGKAKAPDVDVAELEEDVVEVSEEEEVVQRPASKSKHQRTASKSKSKSKAPVTLSDTESSGHYESAVEVAPKKKAPAQTKPPRPTGKSNAADENVALESSIHPPPPPTTSFDTSSTMELPPLFVPKRKVVEPAQALLPSSPASSKLAPPLKPTLQPPKTRKVVEISSDEESDGYYSKQDIQDGTSQVETVTDQAPPPPQFTTPPKPSPPWTNRKKSVTVETVEPFRKTSPDQRPAPELMSDTDVSMDRAELDTDHQMDDVPMPSTPLRSKGQSAWRNDSIVSEVKQPMPEPSSLAPNNNVPIAPAPPPFMPPLSKLPFMPLQSLTDAELDMTVEEWIRYQMDVEFDKFRRDGERELQQFRKKAEEVRKIIEGL